jgi:hypothetical protein
VPKGDQKQHRQAHHLLDNELEQFAGTRINPMRVLEDHQQWLLPRQRSDQPEQRLERLLALALR